MTNYSERIDKVFNTTNYNHRTLRTLFDPYSSEWQHTTFDEKVKILKKIIDSGENLLKIVIEYQAYYKKVNQPDVAKDVTLGLALVLQNVLKSDNNEEVVL